MRRRQAGRGRSGGDLGRAAGQRGGRDTEPVGAWAVEGEGIPSAAGGGVTRRARDSKETERTRAREDRESGGGARGEVEWKIGRHTWRGDWVKK